MIAGPVPQLANPDRRDLDGFHKSRTNNDFPLLGVPGTGAAPEQESHAEAAEEARGSREQREKRRFWSPSGRPRS